jgi:hypothetical protein
MWLIDSCFPYGKGLQMGFRLYLRGIPNDVKVFLLQLAKGRKKFDNIDSSFDQFNMEVISIELFYDLIFFYPINEISWM